MIGIFKKILAGVTPLLLITSVSMAADESGARSDQIQNVSASSTATILRVPIDEQGTEIAEEAEMRIYTGTPVDTSKAVNPEDLWNQSKEVSTDTANDTPRRVSWRPYPRPYYYWPYGGYAYYYYPPYYYPYPYYSYYPHRPYRPHYGW